MVRLGITVVILLAMGILARLSIGPDSAPWNPKQGKLPELANAEPTAVVTLVGEASLIEGKPIQARLTIQNKSDREIELFEIIPSIHGFIMAGTLQFSEAGENLANKPTPERMDFQSRSVLIPAGKAHDIPFILQRYMPQPPAGRHDLSFTFNLGTPFYHDNSNPQAKKADEENPRWPHIHVQGKLALTIQPRNEEKLHETYQALVKTLEIEDPARGGERAEAAEALYVLEDSLAIPYQIQSFQTDPWSLWGACAFDALARFPNDEKARQFMIERVGPGKEGPFVARAMEVLTKWKVELPIGDVRGMLRSKDQQIREATFNYIDAMKPKYNDLAPKPQ